MKSLVAEEARGQPESILNIKYGILGDRTIGAHQPVLNESTGSLTASQDLIFRSAITLQRPVLDPCLAVGFLPLPSNGLRVGQLITMKWRIERLKDLDEIEVSKHNVSPNKKKAIFATCFLILGLWEIEFTCYCGFLTSDLSLLMSILYSFSHIKVKMACFLYFSPNSE